MSFFYKLRYHFNINSTALRRRRDDAFLRLPRTRDVPLQVRRDQIAMEIFLAYSCVIAPPELLNPLPYRDSIWSRQISRIRLDRLHRRDSFNAPSLASLSNVATGRSTNARLLLEFPVSIPLFTIRALFRQSRTHTKDLIKFPQRLGLRCL